MKDMKDLQRFLRRDDPQRQEVFKKVCKWKIASRDLVPIIENYQTDHNLLITANLSTGVPYNACGAIVGGSCTAVRVSVGFEGCTGTHCCHDGLRLARSVQRTENSITSEGLSPEAAKVTANMLCGRQEDGKSKSRKMGIPEDLDSATFL